MSEIKIPLDSAAKDFMFFIEDRNNKQILFSGPFGIGKTYFLKNFFIEQIDKFDVFHLFPVNYQTNSNEDIVELLKYDVLVELLKKDRYIFKGNKISGIYESSLLFYLWAKERYTTNQILQVTISLGQYLSTLSINPFIQLMSRLGRPLTDLLEMDKEFQEFKKDYEKGDRKIIEKYEMAIRTKIASEPDYISSLLKEGIFKQKAEKQSILILDDIDRVDPEQVFRLLNIFSAHFDRERENKYGFDKVIIVADYLNLKSIFHHRYGSETDFSGYIDKFFTIAPYYYDNKKSVIAMTDQIVKAIRYEEPALKNAIGESGYIKLFLEYIFVRCLDAEIINLRELLKSTNYLLSELKKGSFQEDPFADNFQKFFDKAIKIAILSFSNTKTFLQKIKEIKNLPEYNKGMPFDIYIASMLKSFNIKFANDRDEIKWWNDYQISNQSRNRSKKITIIGGGTEKDLFFDLLIEYVKSKKFIKDSFREYHYD